MATESTERTASEVGSAFALSLPLPEACALAERRLRDGVADAVRAAIEAHPLEGASWSSPGWLTYRSVPYELRVREAAEDPTRLCVLIGEAGAPWTVERFAHASATIAGQGRFASLATDLDRRLAAVGEDVTAAVQRHYEAGYRRLTAYATAELLTLQHSLATRLYAEVRGELDERIASCVALYVLLPDGRAGYFLDPLVLQAALARLSGARPHTEASPLELTAALVSASVDVEDTVAVTALAQARPLEFRLEQAKYVSESLYVAERGLYETSELICQPLVREGKVRLIADYPRAMREIVEPRLDGLHDRLADLMAAHASATKRLVGAWRRPDGESVAPRVAELLGHFTAAFVETLA
jgi:hypothetical protein